MTTSENRIPSEKHISFDVNILRGDFPIFAEPVNGKPLIYLDNAATTQKPQRVIDTIVKFYSLECSSVHRGLYFLSDRATEAYENSREKVRSFINAASLHEIVFVRGTTEAINLVAQTYGRSCLKPGDEILITGMEHHSNIVPWQMLCEERGACLRFVPINSAGEIFVEEYARSLGPRTRLVAASYVSNALGTINPVREMIQLAHAQNIPVLVDGAQAVSHIPIDVQDIDCDFFAFSGHKMYGPNGIGVLYAKERLLESMPPYQGGGDMVRAVTMEKTSYESLPHRFEAGTPNAPSAIALGAAIDYIREIGMDSIGSHEAMLMNYGTMALSAVDGLRIIGTARQKAGILSFIIAGLHPHDISTILDKDGIAIRAGHHCAQPVMHFFGISGTARASLGLYNTEEDLEVLAGGLRKVIEVFR